MSRGGLLIWNDCKPEGLADYERWYQEDHLPERVGIPGYRYGVRYEALAGTRPQFFTLYETASPEVLLSPLYRARLAAPSDWTRRVMPLFQNMSRTLCRKAALAGLAFSGAAVTLADLPADRLQDLARDALGQEGCLGWSLWQAVPEPREATPEMALRGGDDRRIEACLVLQLGREAAAQAWQERLATEGAAGAYRLISVLRAEEVAP